MGIFRMLLMGFCAGILGSVIMKDGNKSIVGNVAFGLIGSILGHFLFGIIGLSAYSFIGELLVAVTGTCLFIYLMKKFR